MTEITTNEEQHALSSDNREQALEQTVSKLEKITASTEPDEFEDMEEEQKDNTDYSAFSKDDFVKKAESLIYHANIKEANDAFKKMRLLFDDIIKAERIEQLKTFVAEGHEARDFRPPVDEAKNHFYQAYTRFLEKRAEEKKQAEEEKVKNLNAKRAIIEKLKAITVQDENEKHFAEVRELQKEWKQIRTVPREYMQDLWESYRFYLDKFYDNLTINNELKELDRQKNLEFKIQLCMKVDALNDEKSIKKAHILLNKYHEDYKNTGPVPKEYSEEIWQRFKAASDRVLADKRVQLDQIKARRTQNLELKKALCEKAEQLAQLVFETPKLWKEKTDEIAAIFNEWRTIGPVPEAFSDQIWKRFREAQNQFNSHKKSFFNKLNAGKDDNLKAKTKLCEEAEAIQDIPNFEEGTRKMLALQEKWKTIGPVNEKVSDAIWKRFRAACDVFFKRKEEFIKARTESEKENLVKKEAILVELEALHAAEDPEQVFKSLRELQSRWLQVGFVPMKQKDAVQRRYASAVDAIYKKHKQSAEESKQLRMKEHYEMIAAMPNGADKLKYEERNLSDKIRMLKEDAATLKNNIEFFAKSKNADAMKKQFEEKIRIAENQVVKLMDELKIVRAFKNSHAR